ncbi:hypothetical protein [Deinococcus multiflagellatus]|uniref:hypothetical protein n=1 Tax=Deinococcus multiflagellatus TaxID=1656887 RepID=UPI001CCB91A4|nr:hypothetical protein [Deinococcus multiflagellatus]MBZ9714822.1 hypothetical protein [Deinococcus multiflagellatus]
MRPLSLLLCAGLLVGVAQAGGGQRAPTVLTLNDAGCRPTIGRVVFGLTPDPAASAQLAQIVQADQAARTGNPAQMDWKAVAAQDEARRVQTLALLRSGRLSSARDAFSAALVFQHGDCPAHYQLAHWLAAQALAQGGIREAGWLYGATFDRWQISLGRPQRYGTQFVEVAPCDIQLAPVAAGTTDRDRERLGIPALGLARAPADILSDRCRRGLP